MAQVKTPNNYTSLQLVPPQTLIHFNIISVILVPVIKDKTGKINSKDNYRPIALASVLSKVFERVLLNRLEIYLSTTDNQ